MICLYFIIYQIGIHPFCIAVIDSHGVSSGVSCLALAVGGVNPSTLLPSVVQGSASPVGTVMATHTRFSIRGKVILSYGYSSGSPLFLAANMPLKRTIRSGVSIRIYDNSIGQVRSIDTRTSGDVFFSNTTLIFYVRNPPWVLGRTYRIEFDQGVITANNTCNTESNGFSGK